MKVAMSFRPPFAGLRMPKSWATLESFVEWWMTTGMPMAIPYDAEVVRTDNASAFPLFRHGAFQVEFYLVDPDVEVFSHAHPFIEVIVMKMTGEEVSSNPETSVAHGVAKGWGNAAANLEDGEFHGEPTGPKGEVMLTFSRWPDDVKPTSVAAVWQGQTVGPKHEAIIRKNFPDARIENGWSDITGEGGAPNARL